MAISLLSQKCTVVKQVATIDSIGRPSVYTRTVVHNNLGCRLDTVTLRSREEVEPGASQSVLQDIIYTEYKDNITADMQIELDNWIYNIVAISPVRGSATYHHLKIEVNRLENV